MKGEFTTQKVMFSFQDFFRKCDQIRSFLWIWSHLLKKSFIENLFFAHWVVPITLAREKCFRSFWIPFLVESYFYKISASV